MIYGRFLNSGLLEALGMRENLPDLRCMQGLYREPMFVRLRGPIQNHLNLQEALRATVDLHKATDLFSWVPQLSPSILPPPKVPP